MGDAGGGDIGSHQLEGRHAGQVRRGERRRARQHALALGGGDASLPKRLAAFQPQALQRPRRGQRLHLLHAEIRAARQIGDATKGRGGLHALGGLIPQTLDEVEAQPDFAGGQRPGLRAGVVDAHWQHAHAVAPGVLNERLRRIKAHGLRAQQAHAELRRVVMLEPRGKIHQRGEGLRVRFRETVGGKGGDLGPELLRDLTVDAVGGAQALEKAAAQRGHLGR